MNNLLQKRIFGGFAFLTSFVVYLSTLEPSASFWDCSEFIASAYKLVVGHAPGAPVYMLLGRLFSFMAGGNTQNVAIAINALSAVASALTVMLLFHIIYWFSIKLIKNLHSETTSNRVHFIAVVASLTGSLSYAFTDSFWFSAVEAEVYATSSLFSVLVVWCIIKYEQAPRGWPENRWLVLIFFLLGLSVGIHLLNLLALPAMALVVYHKHHIPTLRKTLLTLSISVLIIVMFIYGIIPGVAKTAAYFDLLAVNNLNLPVYSGVLIFVYLVALALISLYRYFGKTKKHVLRFTVLLISFWLIGYSSFTVLVVRSADDPFVDINNVENVFGLVDYLNREQYPKRPLFYGNGFSSPVIGSEKRFTHKLYNGKYFKDELNPTYEYDPATLSLFPRMASQEPRHVEAYKRWVEIKGRRVSVKEIDGKSKTIVVPTFFDNFRFFMKYQLGHMYLRYFMWNFAGRQNDTQGVGDRFSGNWMSGIPVIDGHRLGSQDQIPNILINVKTRNTYFLIPLLMGILGIFFHMKHDTRNFWVALTLFFFTGPAIVLYLNEVPITPRERDYVHVGSFMVFALWIGLGAGAVFSLWNGRVRSTFGKWALAIALMIGIPGLLLIENWDDHDRSGRFAARDFGKNILSSCDENAILFTTADNDTYPIWYLQQVENFRPDIRQVLTPFLSMDWYGNQMNNSYHGSGLVPVSFKDEELLMKTNQYFPVVPRIDSSIDVKDLIKFIRNSDQRTKVVAGGGEVLNFIPGKNFSLKVDAENLITSAKNLRIAKNEIPDKLNFSIDKKYLTRDEVLILDMIANNKWERPVYTIYPTLFQDIGLMDYLHREGMVFRLLPYKNTNILHDRQTFANHQFELITQKFAWGNVNDPDVFVDHTIKQNVASFRFRQMFAEVADELIEIGEHEKAEQLIDLALQVFPKEKFPFDYYSLDFANCYYKMGEIAKGDTLAVDIYSSTGSKLDYYLQGETINQNQMNDHVQLQAFMMQELIRICSQNNSPLQEKAMARFDKLFQ